MVVAVLLLLLAPAVLGWVVGNLEVRRPDPPERSDVPPELPDRYALTPSEVARVGRAVAFGRPLRQPRLRAAAVDWAEQVAEDTRGSRWSSWAVVAGLVVLFTLAAVQGRWFVVAIGWTLEWQLTALWMEGGPRRAIERNGGPPAP